MSSSPSTSVGLSDIQALCVHFKKTPYSVTSETVEAAKALAICKAMLELDYNVVEINNAGGVLCAHYPSKILLCESELPSAGNNKPFKNEALKLETESDINQLRNRILKARKGRCRARFPIPVIFFQGRNICRSGTTAHYAEIYGRATVELINNYISGTSEDDFEGRGDDDQFKEEQYNKEKRMDLESSVRNNDIQLLKMYNTDTIFDLMVEHKKVKYTVYVTSSEKADAENRYSEFKLISVPYPGCEFFTNFYHNGKQGKNLMFDWEQKMVDKTLTVTGDDTFKDLNINWTAYKSWDIITLTSNYVAYIVRYLQQSKSGILIHCISGWDRTPLFISLVRLSLWADGLIHKSLTPIQMLYFTIAYDWMLFGHNLKNRLAKFEEIFFFCFYMLKHIMHPKCSIRRFCKKSNDVTPQVSPKKDCASTDNGNLQFMIEELRKSNSSICSNSSNVSNVSHDQVIMDHRESEPESNIESDTEESNAGVPHYEMDPDNPDSHSSSREANGNGSFDESADTFNNKKKSSPVPMVGNDSPRDTEAPHGSWTIVTTTGSVHSNDGIASLRDLVYPNRFRRLSRMREDFFRAYYHSISVPYNEAPSTISQVISNLAERVGFS